MYTGSSIRLRSWQGSTDAIGKKQSSRPCFTICYLDNANLAHGPIAAKIMKRDYGITDPDLLNAVRYHTTGRAGMSLLEKVLYLADAIEPGRNYPGVEEIRKRAETSLDDACLLSMERSIRYIEDRGLFLHEDTIKARDDLKKKGEKNGL